MFYPCGVQKILWFTVVSHLIVSGTASPVLSLRSGPITAADLERCENIYLHSLRAISDLEKSGIIFRLSLYECRG